MRPVAPEIIALIDKPWLQLALLAIGAALGVGTEWIAERMSKAQRRAAWEKRTAGKRRGGAAGSGRFGAQIAALGQGKAARPVPDAADQLRIVMDAPFEARALLNKPERRLLVCCFVLLRREALPEIPSFFLPAVLWPDFAARGAFSSGAADAMGFLAPQRLR